MSAMTAGGFHLPGNDGLLRRHAKEAEARHRREDAGAGFWYAAADRAEMRTKAPARDGGPPGQRSLVAAWHRVRLPALAGFCAASLAAGFAGEPSPTLLASAGGALLLFIEGLWQLRRASDRPLASILLDSTALALAMAALEVPAAVLPAPFIYLAATAAFLLPRRRAAAMWIYQSAAFGLVLLAPPLAGSLGIGPSPTRHAIVIGAMTMMFVVMVVAEGVILGGALRHHQEARLAAAEELVRSKDEFLAGVSHALRTPLTCVIGFGRLIESDWADRLPSEAAVMLGELNQQADYLSAMVDNLIVRTEDLSGRLRVAAGPANLHQIAGEVIRSVAWLYPDKTIRLVGDPDVAAWADPVRTRQIVRNLLTNAVQHGGGGITLETAASPAGALLVVGDDGPEDSGSELALSPFAKTTPTAGAPSLGLGLPTCVRLAALMGGRITHRRMPGWAEFTLMLPLMPPCPEAGVLATQPA